VADRRAVTLTPVGWACTPRSGHGKRLPVLLAGVLVLAFVGTVARGADPRVLGQEVLKIVGDRFLDPPRAAAWVKAHASYADLIGSSSHFAFETNRALADLKTSHTRYYTPNDIEYYSLLAIFAPTLGINPQAYDSIGVDLVNGRFIRTVFAASPAEAGGLRRGDEILGADARPFAPVVTFRGQSSRNVTVTIRRRADAAPFEVRIAPRPVAPTKEWRDDQEIGARLIPKSGRNIAYVRVFCASGDPPKELLRDQLAGPLRSADALVLDLRDGWGGANPDFIDIFDARPPILTFVERDGSQRVYDPTWRKPVVALINRGTRSGKEVVAYSIRKHKLGTLVGERTAGAVVAGKPFLLSDRSLLFLAVADVLVDGEHLEGIGVPPDVEVAAPLPYADGSDPQLDAALDIASRAAATR
jgi:carboxyl-terminal processing protease